MITAKGRHEPGEIGVQEDQAWGAADEQSGDLRSAYMPIVEGKDAFAGIIDIGDAGDVNDVVTAAGEFVQHPFVAGEGPGQKGHAVPR